mgnify:FL=1
MRQSPTREVILGCAPDIGRWVGSWTGDEQSPPTGLHAFRVSAAGTDMHAILRLFAQFGAPEYYVAIGPADPAFVASPAWPWQ